MIKRLVLGLLLAGGITAAAGSIASAEGTPPLCKTGTKANFRWHYSADGSSGSWSGTQTQECGKSFSMGPQDMEGDQKLAPGTTMKVGYDLVMPGNKESLSFPISYAKVVFTLECASGATPSHATFTVNIPAEIYLITNDQWTPSGEQNSPLVYQGSGTVPNACGGGLVRLQQGGTFSAYLGEEEEGEPGSSA